jgi:hypothetical protein
LETISPINDSQSLPLRSPMAMDREYFHNHDAFDILTALENEKSCTSQDHFLRYPERTVDSSDAIARETSTHVVDRDITPESEPLRSPVRPILVPTAVNIIIAKRNPQWHNALSFSS